jgi:hypothetical protein
MTLDRFVAYESEIGAFTASPNPVTCGNAPIEAARWER